MLTIRSVAEDIWLGRLRSWRVPPGVMERGLERRREFGGKTRLAGLTGMSVVCRLPSCDASPSGDLGFCDIDLAGYGARRSRLANLVTATVSRFLPHLSLGTDLSEDEAAVAWTPRLAALSRAGEGR